MPLDLLSLPRGGGPIVQERAERDVGLVVAHHRSLVRAKFCDKGFVAVLGLTLASSVPLGGRGALGSRINFVTLSFATIPYRASGGRKNRLPLPPAELPIIKRYSALHLVAVRAEWSAVVGEAPS